MGYNRNIDPKKENEMLFAQIKEKVQSEAFKNIAKEIGKHVVTVIAVATVLTVAKVVIKAHQDKIQNELANISTPEESA